MSKQGANPFFADAMALGIFASMVSVTPKGSAALLTALFVSRAARKALVTVPGLTTAPPGFSAPPVMLKTLGLSSTIVVGVSDAQAVLGLLR